MMIPAAATPRKMGGMARFIFRPITEATKAPVQAPVPGRGMATRINRPSISYL